MRISKLYMPAAAMAGALALAACGGGSDDSPMMPGGGGGGGGGGGTSTLALPEGVTLDGGADLTQGGLRGNYTIKASETLSLPKGAPSVVFTCTGTTDCSITVSEDRNASSVTVSAGTVTVDKYAAPAVMITGRNPPPSSTSTDPLSEATLVKALEGMGRNAADRTVWNRGNTNPSGPAVLTGIAPNTLTTLTRETTNLWIRASGNEADRKAGDSYAYYGHWEKKAEQTLSGAPSPATRGTVWGGNMHYGQKPHASLGEAKYDENDSVIFYYKRGTGKWAEGAARADLKLTADFGNGMVGGNVEFAAGKLGIVGTNPAPKETIYLRDTRIGDNGQFGGPNAKAEFDARAGVTERQDGDWNGGFFGPTTEIDGNGVQGHEEPSYVAGQFSVKRETKATGATSYAHDLTVHGAFGADCNDGCQ